ncbi:hypothetical protein JCM11251_002806 [Rhodosporidiobolus azoricus]
MATAQTDVSTAADMAAFNVDETIGPFVIGTFLALFLQGITLYQSVIFWIQCRKGKEPWAYMIMVAVVDLLDILGSIFAVKTVYWWCSDNYGKPAEVAFSPWSFTAEPVMTGLMATIVHFFYAHRIILVSESSKMGRLIAIGIALLSLVQFGFGAAVTGKIVAFDREFVRFADWLWGACVWLSIAAAVDVVIVGAYFYYLNSVSSQMAGPFERSTKTVVKVATIVLLTNGLSASAAIVATTLFGALRTTNYHAILQLCLAKFLALSLLIALNARTMLADMLDVSPAFFNTGMKRGPVGLAAHRNLNAHNIDVLKASGSGSGGATASGRLDGHSKSLRSPGFGSSGALSTPNAIPGGVVYPITIVRSHTDDDIGSDEKARAFEDEVDTYGSQLGCEPAAGAPKFSLFVHDLPMLDIPVG